MMRAGLRAGSGTVGGIARLLDGNYATVVVEPLDPFARHLAPESVIQELDATFWRLPYFSIFVIARPLAG